jgi:hypothetical protein
MDRTEQLWVLIAILIGFYGNWYFNLLTRLGESQNELVWLVSGVSAFSLFLYCAEITIWKKSSEKNSILSRVILALIHLFTTYLAIVIIEGWLPPTPIGMIGLILWIVIIMYERRFAKSLS